jgi:serine/threonine-protein kinase
VPDISCASDPNFGADTIFAGSPLTEGGTSWASPTCAAFCALINEALANRGLTTLGVLGPHIYPLIGSTSFRDITSGNNATAISGGLYSATTGYDEATGIGVPLVQTLAEMLVGSQNLVGVSEQGAYQSVQPGQNVTFTIAASGSPATFRWQRMSAGNTTWSNLADNGVYSGSATASLSVTGATTAMGGDQFQCLVTYTGSGTVTSAPASVLTVETPWTISTLAGETGVAGLINNTGTAAQFNYPTGLAVDSTGNIYVADLTNNAIRKVTPAGVVTTPYGSLSGTAGSTNGMGNGALFNLPRDIAFDSLNDLLYVADEGNGLIRKITISTGVVSTVAATTTFKNPRGVAVDNSGVVYVADSDNNVIRKIATNGTVTILAGSPTFKAGYMDGTATQALFNQPIGMAVDGSGNVYVGDYGNSVIRKIITSTGVVSTFAGQSHNTGQATVIGPAGVAGYLDGPGSKALFNVPRGLAVDGSGNLYVTDSYAPITAPPYNFSGNNLLRKITPAGVVSTLAGQAGIAGSTDSLGSAAQFFNPCGLAINASGQIYVADASNNTIRSAAVETDVSVSATLAYASANGPAPGQFTVTRTGSVAASLTVNYSVAGTAVSGTDYTALPGSVTIPAGASSATIAVIAHLNPLATSNQTVQLTLSGPMAGVVIDPTPATVTIVERQPIAFSGSPTAIPENDGIPNLLKYLFDINPAKEMTPTDLAALPSPGMTTIGMTDYLTLTYREFVSETGVAVNVQTSFDLKTWTTVTNPTIIVTGLDPTTQDPIMQAQVQMMATPQFIRLNVTQP